ncbi:DUF2165 family protein [Sphingomicrobium sp. XHP0235]|uniref:DUF2165 family protein n=1 Tax=Sphingomicrobium aquimarinum TaxID=3133971 RepID=UPI0031FEB6B0
MFSIYIKPMIVLFGGLQGLLYGIHNILNFEAAAGFVGLVLGQSQNAIYSQSLVPAVESPWLIIVVLIGIVFLEIVGGAIAIGGAAGMLTARDEQPERREKMRDVAASGLGLLVLCWFGLFLCLASAGAQMWQYEAGGNAMNGAFIYGASSALIILLLMAPERRKAT